MRQIRRRIAGLLVGLACLLLLQTSPALSLAWSCEGRLCGVSALFCCCASPEGKTCGAYSTTPSRLFAPSTIAGAVCVAGCGCEQVIVAAHDAPDAAFAPATAIPFPLLARLPAEAFAPLPVTVALNATFMADSRGPPLRSSSLRFVSLRAPPVS